MTYKIEYKLPVPEHRGRGRPAKYPLGNLGVGDSFLVPVSEKINLRACVYQRKRLKPGWDYVTRAEADGIRIWRIS